MGKEKYVVITPARNEEKYITCTLESMIDQSILPLQWVIVNDGSSDNTGAMLDEAAKGFPWITIVHRSDRGKRIAGTGVIESFYDGYKELKFNDWNYIVKLDADLSFSDNYFESIFQSFSENKKLGIASGLCCLDYDGRVVPEYDKYPSFQVRGPSKIYRRECFETIDGLMSAPGWDTIDDLKANMCGWKTKTLRHIKLIHNRSTGGAYGSWNNWVKLGKANYVTGYHPVFMLAKCLKRIVERPYVIHSSGLFWGYVSACIRKVKQVDDKKLIDYVKKEQIKKLLSKPSIW